MVQGLMLKSPVGKERGGVLTQGLASCELLIMLVLTPLPLVKKPAALALLIHHPR